MKTIPLLATALVLLPGSAMASTSRTAPPAKQLGPVAHVTRPCTPLNPCAVPTPALSNPASPSGMERRTYAAAAQRAPRPAR
jgi:hypothetical protein